MGKGSVPRPFSVSNEEYAQRWDAIFGRVPGDSGKGADVPSGVAPGAIATPPPAEENPPQTDEK